MRVFVDRLNGTVSIELTGGPAVRTVAVGRDVTAMLDRFGRLQALRLLKPLDPEIRRTVLPRLAMQFHVPALAHMDPSLLLEKIGTHN